jgi:hypothetical protein
MKTISSTKQSQTSAVASRNSWGWTGFSWGWTGFADQTSTVF